MLITPLGQLEQNYSTLIDSDLSIVVHGPIASDIALLCQDSTVKSCIDAANFISASYSNVAVSVIQVKSPSALSVEELQKVFSLTRFILLIQAESDANLQKVVRELLHVDLMHVCKVEPSDSELVAKIISRIKNDFLI